MKAVRPTLGQCVSTVSAEDAPCDAGRTSVCPNFVLQANSYWNYSRQPEYGRTGQSDDDQADDPGDQQGAEVTRFSFPVFGCFVFLLRFLEHSDSHLDSFQEIIANDSLPHLGLKVSLGRLFESR